MGEGTVKVKYSKQEYKLLVLPMIMLNLLLYTNENNVCNTNNFINYTKYKKQTVKKHLYSLYKIAIILI